MLVPQILEEVVEVVKACYAVQIVPQERISERICEQIVDAPVPHAVNEPVPQSQGLTLEVIQPIPAERIPERRVEEIIHQERISERTKIVDVPVPQTFGTIHQERISERTQIVDAPVPPDFGRARRTRSTASGRNC